MSARRTVAPDISGCSFLIYAATLSFAVLRAPYLHKTFKGISTDLLTYGGLLVLCLTIALGLFQRRMWALWPAIIVSVSAVVAGAMAWHVPETAQLPAGVLGATSIVLLLASRGEFLGTDPKSPVAEDE